MVEPVYWPYLIGKGHPVSAPAASSGTALVSVMVEVSKDSCNRYQYGPTNAVQISQELVKRRALLRQQV